MEKIETRNNLYKLLPGTINQGNNWMNNPNYKMSHLIQRLTKPFQMKIADHVIKDNPFSFGGGLKNGGLTEEGMVLIRDIFGFDYMGSAEFEWGAVPQALKKIIENAEKLIDFEVDVDVNVHRWEKDKKAKLNVKMYVLCPKEMETYVKELLKVMGKDIHSLSWQEVPWYDSCFDSSSSSRVEGWLELDNGFFFFKDKEMFDKTKALFKGVK